MLPPTKGVFIVTCALVDTNAGVGRFKNVSLQTYLKKSSKSYFGGQKSGFPSAFLLDSNKNKSEFSVQALICPFVTFFFFENFYEFL